MGPTPTCPGCGETFRSSENLYAHHAYDLCPKPPSRRNSTRQPNSSTASAVTSRPTRTASTGVPAPKPASDPPPTPSAASRSDSSTAPTFTPASPPPPAPSPQLAPSTMLNGGSGTSTPTIGTPAPRIDPTIVEDAFRQRDAARKERDAYKDRLDEAERQLRAAAAKIKMATNIGGKEFFLGLHAKLLAAARSIGVDLTAYEALATAPTHVHHSREQHGKAVLALAEAIGLRQPRARPPESAPDAPGVPVHDLTQALAGRKLKTPVPMEES